MRVYGYDDFLSNALVVKGEIRNIDRKGQRILLSYPDPFGGGNAYYPVSDDYYEFDGNKFTITIPNSVMKGLKWDEEDDYGYIEVSVTDNNGKKAESSAPITFRVWPPKLSVDKWAGGDDKIDASEYYENGLEFSGMVEKPMEGKPVKASVTWTPNGGSSVKTYNFTDEIAVVENDDQKGVWSVKLDSSKLMEAGFGDAKDSKATFTFSTKNAPDVSKELTVDIGTKPRIVVDDMEYAIQNYSQNGMKVEGHVLGAKAAGKLEAYVTYVKQGATTIETIPLDDVDFRSSGWFMFHIGAGFLGGVNVFKNESQYASPTLHLKLKGVPGVERAHIMRIPIHDSEVVVDSWAGDGRISVGEVAYEGAHFSGTISDWDPYYKLSATVSWKRPDGTDATHKFAESIKVEDGKWSFDITPKDFKDMGIANTDVGEITVSFGAYSAKEQTKTLPIDAKDADGVHIILDKVAGPDGLIDEIEYTQRGAEFSGKTLNYDTGTIKVQASWSEGDGKMVDYEFKDAVQVKDGKWSFVISPEELKASGLMRAGEEKATFTFHTVGGDEGQVSKEVSLNLVDQQGKIVFDFAGGADGVNDSKVDYADLMGSGIKIEGHTENYPEGHLHDIVWFVADGEFWRSNTTLTPPYKVEVQDGKFTLVLDSAFFATKRFNLLDNSYIDFEFTVPGTQQSYKKEIRTFLSKPSVAALTVAGGDSVIDANEFTTTGAIFKGNVEHAVQGDDVKVSVTWIPKNNENKPYTHEFSEGVEVVDGKWEFNATPALLAESGILPGSDTNVTFHFKTAYSNDFECPVTLNLSSGGSSSLSMSMGAQGAEDGHLAGNKGEIVNLAGAGKSADVESSGKEAGTIKEDGSGNPKKAPEHEAKEDKEANHPNHPESAYEYGMAGNEVGSGMANEDYLGGAIII